MSRRQREQGMFFKIARSAGCHWAKVHKSEKDRMISWRLMEWESREAFNRTALTPAKSSMPLSLRLATGTMWFSVSPTRQFWRGSKAKEDIYHNYL
jgi:hypothetical protein